MGSKNTAKFPPNLPQDSLRKIKKESLTSFRSCAGRTKDSFRACPRVGPFGGQDSFRRKTQSANLFGDLPLSTKHPQTKLAASIGPKRKLAASKMQIGSLQHANWRPPICRCCIELHLATPPAPYRSLKRVSGCLPALGSKKCPKQSRNSLRSLKIDCFETPETVSRLFRTLFGPRGRKAPGDSFETLSGSRRLL